MTLCLSRRLINEYAKKTARTAGTVTDGTQKYQQVYFNMIERTCQDE